ncbi:MAG: hypothetical protein A2785_01785 [Candidatus Chisholmbacteria bacterium RIFCSPHIGHO2_01_FULL_49_18]|uniref:Uncharacterized protein n=2 Tax=Candidatus Chisholmiibacteriota TaxID=1817900 RepID=A0A1G1VMQ1_9BACT|nr:MAG: hypothetical protein A2785_01785 [Candidatus Chisholmbacteria bacterium RIFCSPHIGHO2_01_FULL_49_18]OGY21328.1 MAG: hypothetical protein A3A65_05170 [Candidatus Chisholmbacteria bacterium RIFCSPLOWO2_01_FULL_49_14]
MVGPEFFFDTDGSLSSELGISVPIAPVVVRAYHPFNPQVSTDRLEWDSIFHPICGETTWLTSPVEAVQGDERFDFLALIDEQGFRSEFGFAVPHGQEEPFFFYHRGGGLGIAEDAVPGLEVRRFPRDPRQRDDGLAVYEVSHPYISDQVPRESYLLIHSDDENIGDLLRNHVPFDSLISGYKRSTPLETSRVVWWLEKVPFEYFLGLNQPGLHNLFGKEEPRVSSTS